MSKFVLVFSLVNFYLVVLTASVMIYKETRKFMPIIAEALFLIVFAIIMALVTLTITGYPY